MTSQRYSKGARVTFRSSANPDMTFVGCIQGYSRDGEYAFIRDEGYAKARPVCVRRILGYAIRSDVPRVVA